MRKKATLCIAALLSTALGAEDAWAWGASGHRMLSEIAMRNLPADLPAFLINPDAIRDIGELAREPDRSRGSGVPHDPDLDPAHFVDVSDDGTVAGIPLGNLPATRAEYAAQLHQAATDDYKVGYLPYAIAEGWQQLVKDLAYWRADVAGQKRVTAENRAWLVRDQHLRELLTIRDLGFWSHFVGDASQPMHASVHYDGWGNFPNPEGYPTQRGLHAQFESAFVRTNVTESDLQTRLPTFQPRDGTIRDWIASYLKTSQAKINALYTLAKIRPFNSADPDEKSFVIERLTAGSAELRDLVAEAWRASPDASLGTRPAITAHNIEIGQVPENQIMVLLRGDD